MDNPTIVIFGATGDLTKQKLVPALQEIYQTNTAVKIIGFARRELTTEEFRESLSITGEHTEEFTDAITYHQGAFEDLAAYESFAKELSSTNLIFYLAVAPASYEIIVGNLKAANLNIPTSRIIIEKPFGDDAASARLLYQSMNSVFAENQIYIIDHYLGKETVQNIVTFRLANSIFENVWNNQCIDNIQITLAESEGISGRGGYYDHAGALKDMIQSHALQVLAATCMEPPESFNPQDIHRSRASLLQSLHQTTPQETEDDVVFGQYDGYKSEVKVEPDSHTDTYVALKTSIENDRWNGVPIYIRTGKKLAERTSEVFIVFKKPLNTLFANEAETNFLAFRLQPNDGISLRMFVKTPGSSMGLQDIHMDFCYRNSFSVNNNSYIRLLEDAINNNKSLFTTLDEIVASWNFIEPFVAYEHDHPDSVHAYHQGSWGPDESNMITAQDSKQWMHLNQFSCDISLTV